VRERAAATSSSQQKTTTTRLLPASRSFRSWSEDDGRWEFRHFSPTLETDSAPIKYNTKIHLALCNCNSNSMVFNSQIFQKISIKK
jgi:hypothetical protein